MNDLTDKEAEQEEPEIRGENQGGVMHGQQGRRVFPRRKPPAVASEEWGTDAGLASGGQQRGSHRDGCLEAERRRMRREGLVRRRFWQAQSLLSRERTRASLASRRWSQRFPSEMGAPGARAPA